MSSCFSPAALNNLANASFNAKIADASAPFSAKKISSDDFLVAVVEIRLLIDLSKTSKS
jgi:hypothetical protein